MAEKIFFLALIYNSNYFMYFYKKLMVEKTIKNLQHICCIFFYRIIIRTKMQIPLIIFFIQKCKFFRKNNINKKKKKMQANYHKQIQTNRLKITLKCCLFVTFQNFIKIKIKIFFNKTAIGFVKFREMKAIL